MKNKLIVRFFLKRSIIYLRLTINGARADMSTNHRINPALWCKSLQKVKGKHEKEAKIYETGLELFPEYGDLIWVQALCTIGTGDTSKTTQLTNKLIEILTSLGNSSSDIESSLGYLYQQANLSDNAEEHRRAALKLDPNNYRRMNSLAAFLINYDKDIW